MVTTRRDFLQAGVALAAMSPFGALAQAWPSRNIMVSATLAAGSGLDVVARLYAERLSTALGKPVIVENRPGGRQMIAANAAVKAEPDGHAFAVVTSTLLATGPTLFKDFRFDSGRDFVPVSLYLKAPFVLVVPADSPVRDFKGLVAAAKASEHPWTYSSLGPGTPQHLIMEMIKQTAGFKADHVPYTNTSQAILDVVSGQVSTGFLEAASSIPLIKDGKLRALAVSSSTPFPLLPGVPPIAEAAGTPGLELVSWHALIAHPATPKAILDRVNGEMTKIMSSEDMQGRLTAIGLIPMPAMALGEIDRFVAVEREKWGAIVRKLGLEGSQ